jgi:plastocyanin
MTRPAGWLALAAAMVAAAVAGGAAHAAMQHKLSAVGEAYSPSTLKAKVGDTILYVNNDIEPHWLYVPTIGFQISRANVKPGDSLAVKLAKPGTFKVLCALHTGMAATVTVEP